MSGSASGKTQEQRQLGRRVQCVRGALAASSQARNGQDRLDDGAPGDELAGQDRTREVQRADKETPVAAANEEGVDDV